MGGFVPICYFLLKNEVQYKVARGFHHVAFIMKRQNNNNNNLYSSNTVGRCGYITEKKRKRKAKRHKSCRETNGMLLPLLLLYCCNSNTVKLDNRSSRIEDGLTSGPIKSHQ